MKRHLRTVPPLCPECVPAPPDFFERYRYRKFTGIDGFLLYRIGPPRPPPASTTHPDGERHVSAFPDTCAVTSFRGTRHAQIGGALVCPSSKASECHSFCTAGLKFNS